MNPAFLCLLFAAFWVGCDPDDRGGGRGGKILVTSITLNKADTTLAIGAEETLSATVLPDNATNTSVEWSSSDDSIATVDKNGRIKAHKAGSVKVSATAADGGGASASCEVTVKKDEQPKACLERDFLNYFGKNRLMVGAQAERVFFQTQQNRGLMDVRYLYLANAVSTSPDNTPCLSCAEACNPSYHPGDSGWWGCWVKNHPAGAYLKLFLDDAQADGQIPMVSYYTFYHTMRDQLRNPNEGHLDLVNQRQYLARYFNDWRFMLEQIGERKVILHMEPDLWGYAQKVRENSSPRDIPAVVSQANPTDCGEGFENNFAGFSRCLIHMVRVYAPGAKVGLHASAWAVTNSDANLNVLPNGMSIRQHAEEVVRYLKLLGSDETDFLVLEALDRDAGCYQVYQGPRGNVHQCGWPDTSHWWDDTNQELPNFHQHFEWAQALRAAVGKPLVWWQLPLGNENSPNWFYGQQSDCPPDAHSSDNPVCAREYNPNVPPNFDSSADLGNLYREIFNQNPPRYLNYGYKDNRVDYFLSHMDDFVSAGGVLAAFGAGKEDQTNPLTDGGNFARLVRAYQQSAAGDDYCSDATLKPESIVVAPTPRVKPRSIRAEGFGDQRQLFEERINDNIGWDAEGYSLPHFPVNASVTFELPHPLSRILFQWMGGAYNYNAHSTRLCSDEAPCVPDNYRIEVSSDGTSWRNVLGDGIPNPHRWQTRAYVLEGDNIQWIRFTNTGAIQASVHEIDIHDLSQCVQGVACDTWGFIGDSITSDSFGRGLPEVMGQPFNALVHASNPARFPSMINFGIGGDKTAEILERLQTTLDDNPGIYFWAIGIGTNNTINNEDEINAFKRELRSILDTLLRNGKQPLLALMPYRRGPMWDGMPTWEEVTPAKNAIIREILNERAYRNRVLEGPDLYPYFSEKHDERMRDLTHPTHNENGIGEINKLWAKVASAFKTP